MKKNTTIYDIANEAKVSPSTVSRVLTGNERVKPETKRRVLAVIEKHNFRPNSLARSLLYKRSKTIGIILPDINHPFFSTLVQKMETKALALGYTTFLCNTMNDYENESTYLQTLIDKRVDGILFLGGRINDVKSNKSYVEEMNKIMEQVPVVFVNGSMENVDAHVVRTDESDGIHKAIDLLWNFNHRKIAFIGGIKGVTSTEIKLDAFYNAMNKHQLDINMDWVMDEGFDIESGEELAKSLLSLEERPTAIICVNDFIAIGVIRILNKFGIRVPEDVSVVGFDDSYLAQYFPPGITSVTQNYDFLGEKAVELLVELINGENPAKEWIIPTKLIVRDSCQVLNA
ncbi:LacI family DNA-binding transcriptional regulator [Gracilibacillus alcaliphilus]|uniref:LacI family DNA-binding transcriptional regulator n=1 Tax=Gracilibacillus alcaliphilus TaxID=1401441 RepID=UPI00195AD7C4|nr:LacI family DNA-binding transcriptional regulator [Gracilibacillus alcaliphilus]MBM7675703.1 LacI family transcriptional regulator/LacI family purine nucleotide synthesis repressor/LacI family repressor for deo operon, udp, cdd, tsx, nupC, and nupG [Gracilibacillus alcaliphilus]